ncbi:hypothetical protein ACIBJF_40390 [Streptomyces sp. NPDC050743]|uniref:hypothetical protein n=1 Tax=Streptomyces sp. NPDC050743 TaxID=3365634 RepID=UPI0037A3820D
MADEQYKWLDRETAERLLRGESLEAVDASAHDQAERLSRALGALSVQTARATGELPGEQAALAAFRKAREAAGAERTAVGRAGGTSGLPVPVPGADAGLVRIGARDRTGIPPRRPRWARPVRLALAAVVAVGTVGGVAMAAGTGMLGRPFGPERPGPATSVSSGPSSGAPLASVPQGTPGATTGPGTPGGSRGGAVGPDDRTGKSTTAGSGEPSGTAGSRWKDATSACRDIRDGKELSAGRRRALENLAGGSARVSRYCKVVLATTDPGDGATSGGKADDNGNKGKGKGKGSGNNQGGDEEGNPGRGGDGHHGEGGGHSGKGVGGGKGRHGDEAAPAPTAFAPPHPARTTGTALGPTPSPTYSTL